MVSEGDLLWEPSEEWKERANITSYMESLGGKYETYEELWKWSVSDLPCFWESIYKYFKIESSSQYKTPLIKGKKEGGMIGSRWFEGAKVNYAEHVFRNVPSSSTALIFSREGEDDIRELSWQELEKKTSSLARFLRDELGIKKGERIVGFLPNIPETVISFLACSSLGAIWSCCSPDFGAPSVIDRFKQIGPRVLISATSSTYNGKSFDKRDVVSQIDNSLPTLESTILITEQNKPKLNRSRAINWEDAVSTKAKMTFERVPFNDPLWILYSSGTTGLPKPLVHSQGGILLEHYKTLGLHNDLKRDDRMFWFTTTGWMMWNYLVSSLLVGATIVLYDGSPAYPNFDVLWNLADKVGITFFGTSAAFVSNCMKAGIHPKENHSLRKLRGLGSTGSPLSPDAFKWLYDNVKDFWVASISGGTDVCSGLIACCPLLPVTAGEIQCRCLGAKVEAYNSEGKPVLNEMGELVVSEPMPSMPVYLWGDEGDKRYVESYFEMFPGVWRHGDWIKITDRGTCVIYGRSDSTIKRSGLRMGTSEIYRAVEELPEISDSLVVDFEGLGGRSEMIIFVVPKKGSSLDTSLIEKIKKKIAKDISPRYVPDQVIEIPEVPRTLNGKKLEVPIKKILMGVPKEKALSLDAMSNPSSLDFFIKFVNRA